VLFNRHKLTIYPLETEKKPKKLPRWLFYVLFEVLRAFEENHLFIDALKYDKLVKSPI